MVSSDVLCVDIDAAKAARRAAGDVSIVEADLTDIVAQNLAAGFIPAPAAP